MARDEGETKKQTNRENGKLNKKIITCINTTLVD